MLPPNVNPMFRGDALPPGMSDKGKIFDGWIIQKVAGLQCLAIDFEEWISTLESRAR